MARKTQANLRDRTELILEDSGNAIFQAADVTSRMGDAVKRVSESLPQKIKYIVNVANDSREVDIDTEGLLEIEKVECPVDQHPRRYIRWERWNDKLYLDIPSKPAASSLGTLTGTVTFSDGSTAISGSSTLFTSELEEGWYIQKSTGSTWYPIETITDDTNLVLGVACVTADDGADTASATKYWFKYAFIYCDKDHYLTEQTDLVGAIDLVAGYAKGSMLIHVDALGSGTIDKNSLLTIAGVVGTYRVTADATIAGNEVDLKISPSLESIAPNNAVVTIQPSSLYPSLERILPELLAGMVAQDHVGDARTEIASAVTLHTTITTAIGKLGTEAVLAIADLVKSRDEINKTDISGVITAVNQIQKQVDRAEKAIKKGDAFIGKKNDEAVGILKGVPARIDKAISDIGMAKSRIIDRTGNAITAVDAMAAQTTLGIADLASARDLQNTVARGQNPVMTYIQSAGSQYQAALTKSGEVSANLRLKGMNTDHLNGANSELNAAMAKINLSNSYLNVDTPSTLHNNNAARELQAANTLLGKANVLLNLDVKSASYMRNAQVEIQAGNAYLGQGNTYISQLTARLRIVSSVYSGGQTWAANKIAKAERDLDRLVEPGQTEYY